MKPEQIGRALMTNVYTRLTCIVGHDAREHVTDGYVLDTLYARYAVRACEHAAGYWVILGPPKAGCRWTSSMRTCWIGCAAALGIAPVRAFIAGEEIG